MELFPEPFGPRTKLNRSRSRIVAPCDRKFLKVRVVIRIGFSIAIAHYWFCMPTGGMTGYKGLNLEPTDGAMNKGSGFGVGTELAVTLISVFIPQATQMGDPGRGIDDDH